MLAALMPLGRPDDRVSVTIWLSDNCGAIGETAGEMARLAGNTTKTCKLCTSLVDEGDVVPHLCSRRLPLSFSRWEGCPRNLYQIYYSDNKFRE